MSLLIIDDEKDILWILQEHAAFAGIECATVASAEAGLELHKQRMFPVVLTDIMMPGMNGIELIKKIKEIHPTCIVFVMTGYSTLSRLVECLEAGASDYFVKPFSDVNILVETLQAGIDRHVRWKRELARTRKE